MTPDLYGQVWDILVEHVGALARDRDRFVQLAVERRHAFNEWRFIGTLGYGGKLWRTDGRLYVNCYSEDMTPDKKAAIDKVNGLLAKFKVRDDLSLEIVE